MKTSDRDGKKGRAALEHPWVSLHTLNTPALQHNMAYLEMYAPELKSLIHNALQTESLWLQEEDGLIRGKSRSQGETWLFGGTDVHEELHAIRHELVVTPRELGLLVLHGNAIGYTLAHVIPRLHKNPHLHVLVYESSPARIYACLALLDIRSSLATGRLHFAYGESRISSVCQAIEQLKLLEVQPAYLLNGPEVAERIDPSYFALALQERYKAYRVEMDRLRVELVERAEMKIINTVSRVLLIDCWPGAPGEAHTRAIQNALHQRGLATRYLVLNRYQIDAFGEASWRSIEPQILRILREFSPELVISYGYHAPKFLRKEWFEASGAVWLQAVSNIAYYDTAYYPGEQTALIEEHLIPYFQKRGAPHPFFIPLMADYVAERPLPTSRQIPIVFVGNSLGLAPPAVQEFFARWAGRDDLIEAIRAAEAELGVFSPEKNLYQYLVQNRLPQLESEAEEYAIFRYLLCQGSAARRRTVLERIAGMGLHLFGGDWKAYLPPESPLHGGFRGYLPM
ncbi:MAG: hypothetical protein RBU29_11975, partial [bacterium]|nr:hypothetical protein [bacterium]